jgi:hypothetical protein
MSAPTLPTPTPTAEWGAQPPTPKKNRPIMRVVGLVIGGLLVVGVVNSAMSADNQAQATGNQPKAAAPAPKPESKQEPVLSDAQKMSAWWPSVESDFNEFTSEQTELAGLTQEAIDTGDTSKLEDKLVETLSTVRKLQDADPCPVREYQEHWSQALSFYETGYETTLDGVRNMDPATISAGAGLISSGTNETEKATDVVKSL